MLIPRKVISHGRLGLVKRVATIAVFGYLNFGYIPPPPIPDAGGGGSWGGTKHKYSYEEQEEDNRREREKQEERFLIEFLKTATDIINNQ